MDGRFLTKLQTGFCFSVLHESVCSQMSVLKVQRNMIELFAEHIDQLEREWYTFNSRMAIDIRLVLKNKNEQQQKKHSLYF